MYFYCLSKFLHISTVCAVQTAWTTVERAQLKAFHVCLSSCEISCLEKKMEEPTSLASCTCDDSGWNLVFTSEQGNKRVAGIFIYRMKEKIWYWHRLEFVNVWLSLPVITFFPTSEFPYMLIRFLLHSSLVKSDNEIGKFSY